MNPIVARHFPPGEKPDDDVLSLLLQETVVDGIEMIRTDSRDAAVLIFTFEDEEHPRFCAAVQHLTIFQRVYLMRALAELSASLISPEVNWICDEEED